MLPKVAIIYLSYNSRPYLDEVVLSLERLTYPKDRLEFVIVDNASPDASAQMIREQVLPKSCKELPQVTFFPSDTNVGFSAGNNVGIEHALRADADYVYLLNNDAKLDARAIDEAVALAESDTKIGAVQSLMLLWQKPDTINSTGGMVHFLGFGFVRDNGRKIPPLPEGGLGGVGASLGIQDGEEIAYASGAAVLYRASVLRRVGLLDPFYFLYHEDLELGWRLRLSGFKNVISMKSIAYHHYEFKRSIQKFFWMERNRVLVHARHLRPLTLALLMPWMLALEIALFLLSFKGGWTREKLRAWGVCFRPSVWRRLMEKREESLALREVPDREIVRLFTSRIDHQETSNAVVTYFGNPILFVVWNTLKPLIRW